MDFCRICGISQDISQTSYNIFSDELCFDVKSKVKTKIYICLNNFLFEKLYAEDESSSYVCKSCIDSLLNAYSFMIFVRQAEHNKWKSTIVKPEEKEENVVQEVTTEEEIIDDDDDFPAACDDELIEEDDPQEEKGLKKFEKELVKPTPAKKQKMTSGLPDSIRFTNYELQRLENNVIVLNVSASTMYQPEIGNYVFPQIMKHSDPECVYQCKYCIKAFSNSEFLLKHVCSVHLCFVCLEIVENYKNLNVHMQSHKEILCQCGKSCENPASFRQHLKKQHLLQLPAHIGVLAETSS